MKNRRTKYASVAIWMFLISVLWLYGSRDASARQLIALTAMAYIASWVGAHWFTNQSRRVGFMRFIAFNTPLLIAVASAELLVFSGAIDFRHIFGTPVDPWQNTKNRLDQSLIHIHRPHYHARGKLMGGDLVLWRNAPPLLNRDYDIQYDHIGFRNNTDYSKADCIVLGDSFIEAGNVSSDELHTTLMAQSLGISTVNLGQSYYGPQQERIVLERFGVAHQPKICFWVFFEGNDLDDIQRYESFVQKWPDSVSDYHSRGSRSFTKNLFIRLSRATRSKDFHVDRSYSGLFPTPEGAIPLWFGYESHDLSSVDQLALDSTIATLEQAYAKCKIEGITLIFVFAPTKFRVYGDLCDFEQGSPTQTWKVNDLPNLFQERLLAVSKEIGFLDLTPDLRSAAEEGSILYYRDDSHWSPEGHRVTAQSLSQFLRTNHMDLLPKETTRE